MEVAEFVRVWPGGHCIRSGSSVYSGCALMVDGFGWFVQVRSGGILFVRVRLVRPGAP